MTDDADKIYTFKEARNYPGYYQINPTQAYSGDACSVMLVTAPAYRSDLANGVVWFRRNARGFLTENNCEPAYGITSIDHWVRMENFVLQLVLKPDREEL